jgi:hypothetical protein
VRGAGVDIAGAELMLLRKEPGTAPKLLSIAVSHDVAWGRAREK